MINYFKSILRKNTKNETCSSCPYKIEYDGCIENLSSKWHPIEETTNVPISGMYLVLCKGDNRMIYKTLECFVGDKFYQIFQSSDIEDGWAVLKPAYYLYIPAI